MQLIISATILDSYFLSDLVYWNIKMFINVAKGEEQCQK